MFVTVALAVIIPGVILGVSLLTISSTCFFDSRIDRFKSCNTMLKNSIASEGYAGEMLSSDINAQIEWLSNMYNCRIQIVNSAYTIIKDTDKNGEGKTSISKNVIDALSGADVYIRNDKEEYVEFAMPLGVGLEDGGDNIVGALYIHYSTSEVEIYSDSIEKYVVIAECLIIVFALIIAWLCSVFFTRPIHRIEESVEDIVEDREPKKRGGEYSEVKKISDEFEQVMEKLNRQDQSRQEFVSNVSHELKTPITSMKVLADSLLGQKGVSEDLYQEFLRDISKEIDRENDIITDLLGMVKMEQADTNMNIQSVNINAILEVVLKRLKPIAQEKNIELILESFRPVVADVDEVKFARMVTNLAENAIKYNDPGGSVTVSLNADHQYMYLKVEDTGIGISDEDQERVFERFYRVDQARARQTGGTGLGLAIAKEIVESHNGSIKIYSKEGEGTTFTVRIPLKYISPEAV